MKHPDDNRTIDMLEPAKNKGGRPRGASKLTDKEKAKARQKARRLRLAEAGVGFMTIQVSASTLERMAELGIGKTVDKNAFVERVLRAHLFPELAAQGAEAA